MAGRGNAPSRRLGKVLTFMGVMLLVVGLVGGGAGAAPGAHANDTKGKSGAFGQLKKTVGEVLESLETSASEAGANEDCGDYCSTSDGTPSGNGNGNGAENSNKPCAGCVGNADDKNPPGQFKDGDDPNNGYECDGNSGVARGNPAHSGCRNATTTTTVPQTTTTTVAQTTTTTAPPDTTTTTVAQTTTTVAVGGTTTVPEVGGVQFSRGTETARGLASTGAGFMRPFTLLGALLLLVGVALMIVRVGPAGSRA